MSGMSNARRYRLGMKAYRFGLREIEVTGDYHWTASRRVGWSHRPTLRRRGRGRTR